jgi:hypothetical protein
MCSRVFVVLLACMLGACSSLLPRGSSDAPAGFASFEEAQAAAEHVIAFKRPTAELAGLRFAGESAGSVLLH